MLLTIFELLLALLFLLLVFLSQLALVPLSMDQVVQSQIAKNFKFFLPGLDLGLPPSLL